MIQRKSKVIMMPTEKGRIYINDGVLHDCKYTQHIPTGQQEPQHLYFLSDDGIQVGDWVYVSFFMSGIQQVQTIEVYQNTPHSSEVRYHFTDGSYGTIEKKGYYKIIATTDPSLKTLCNQNTWDNSNDKFLPIPSDSFIKEYCEVGGIDEVMVEYIAYCISKSCGIANCMLRMIPCESRWYEPEFKLKVAPDNTITIHKIKDSWSREEVIELCHKAFYQYIDGLPYNTTIFEEWVKENL